MTLGKIIKADTFIFIYNNGKHTMFKKTLISASLLVACSASATPKYVLYMIGDGMGPAHRQVAEYYAQNQKNDANFHLAMNSLPVTGVMTSHSANSLVTDSAAAGTALAAGVKTNNGMIAVTPDGKPVTTMLEQAEKHGVATGLVTTTRLTHATPAAFATHNINRNDENAIAVDYLDSGVDVLLGGGWRYFTEIDGKTKRKDGRDVVADFKKEGYKTFITEESLSDFRQYSPKKGDKVLGLFTYSHLPYAIDRKADQTPSLAELTDKAINLLEKDKDGFFLMVEGGRIDHASHANDVAGTVGDTLAFDAAVQSALDFYNKHPKETLLVVVSDHETGGIGLGLGKQYFMNLENIAKSHESIEDKLQKVYKGDRKAFFAHIANKLELTDLTQEEIASIEKAMDVIDSGKIKKDADVKAVYGGYDPVAMAVAHVTAKRAGIYWTSYAHTGTQLTVSAIGNDAQNVVGGFNDNTQVAKNLAKTMHVTIGK